MKNLQAEYIIRDSQRFKDLTYDGYRQLAQSEHLSDSQRIGFPDAYRVGHEEAIFADWLAKIPALQANNRSILDIGPGCGPLPRLMIEHCHKQGHTLQLCDSAEMLRHLPEIASIKHYAGCFPRGVAHLLEELHGRVDGIVIYSVLHAAFSDGFVNEFLDAAVQLLAVGGTLLVGDIPNTTMRQRYFSSATGKEAHCQFTGNASIEFPTFQPNRIDDATLLEFVARYRAIGYHAWLVPQPAILPLATRREDLIIMRP